MIKDTREKLKAFTGAHKHINFEDFKTTASDVAALASTLLQDANAQYELLLNELAHDDSLDSEVEECDASLTQVQTLVDSLRSAPSTEVTASSELDEIFTQDSQSYKLIVNTALDKAVVSSGSSYIVDATYHSEGSHKRHQFQPMEVKVKLSRDGETLRREFDILNLLAEQATNHFVRAFKLVDSSDISFKRNDGDNADDRSDLSSLQGIAMQRGDELNLKWFLILNKAHLDLFHRLPFAIDVIKTVAAIHRVGYAWMDVKPHNFITLRNHDGLQQIRGIDLDHARLLTADLPSAYCEVTWEYASPELAFRDSTGQKVSLRADQLLSTPEQFDIWALGITVLEILDDGNSFCSRVGGDVPAIQEKLRGLTSDSIAQYVNSRFKGSELQSRAIRSFLLTTLKLNPLDRPRASDLLAIIQGSQLSGFTATNKLIAEGFLKQDEHFAELNEKINKLSTSLASFQTQVVATIKDVSFSLVRDSTSEDLLLQTASLEAAAEAIARSTSLLEQASNATDIEKIFKNQFKSVIDTYMREAVERSQENSDSALIASMERQQKAIEKGFSQFTAISEAARNCSSREFTELRNELTAKMSSIHDDFQLVGRELAGMSTTLKRIEEGQTDSHAQVIAMFIAGQEQTEESNEAIRSVMGVLSNAVQNIEQISGSLTAHALQNVIAKTVSEISSQSSARLSAEVLSAISGAVSNSLATSTAADSDSQAQVNELMVSNLKALRIDMQHLLAQNEAMHEDIRLTRQEFAKHSCMLQTILSGEHRVPTLMIVVPKEPKSVLGRLKRVVRDKMHIYFVCPMTMRLGYPYELTLPSQFLVKVAPLLKLSLLMLKVALAVAALPIPVPQFDMDLNRFGGLLDDLQHMLQVEIDGGGGDNLEVARAVDEIDNAMDVVQRLHTADAAALRKISTQQQKVAALTKPSYGEVYTLLKAMERRATGGSWTDREDWMPSQTGLVRVTSRCDGMTAWILNNSDVVGEFHSLGSKALMVL